MTPRLLPAPIETQRKGRRTTAVPTPDDRRGPPRRMWVDQGTDGVPVIRSTRRGCMRATR